MNIIVLFFPMIVWMIIVGVIVGMVKANAASRSRARRTGYTRPQPGRPQMQRDLFEARKPARKNRGVGKTSFDDYSPKGRKKDFVDGYDKKYTDRRAYRQAGRTQYTHTYNGHEPWDKCLPKEKDPWDKDFRAE